jgi:hypothetical protein
VPYQQIASGESFTFGVVAFSKAGIDHIDFDIVPSSGTYTCSADSGETCVDSDTVRTTTMRNNTRLARVSSGEISGWSGWTGVWEYYITIKSSEFSADTLFTVTPTVYGSDGGTRVITATTMLVDTGTARSAPDDYDECWVDMDGSDGTGTANDSNDPYPSIETAIAGCQTANGGSSDWNIIYLAEDTYDSLGSATTTTTNGYITFRKAAGASRDNVIITDDGGLWTTSLLHFKNVTLSSPSVGSYVVNDNVSSSPRGIDYLWCDGCKLTTEYGRWTSGCGGGNCTPLHTRISMDINYYVTDSFIYDVDRGEGDARLIRNTCISTISEDGNANPAFVVNVRLDNIDPSDGLLPAYPHSDCVQTYGLTGDANVIIYNFFATDAHYQGFFMGNGSEADYNNVAMVNNIIEMRDPGRKGSAGGNVIHVSGSFYPLTHNRNHWLWWYNSFPYEKYNFYIPAGTGSITNSSIVGNVFWEFVTGSAWASGNEVDPLENGNTDGNEALYNQYGCSYTITGGACENVYAKAPDSSAGRTTFQEGDGTHPAVVDITDTTTYVDFGEPLLASGLRDALPSNIVNVPADVYGNRRDSTPDIGAVEYVDQSSVAGTHGRAYPGKGRNASGKGQWR